MSDLKATKDTQMSDLLIPRKGKSTSLHADGDSAQETMVTKEYSALELLELGESFKQAKRISHTCLVRPWDMGADGLTLSAVEAEKLKDVTISPEATGCTS